MLDSQIRILYHSFVYTKLKVFNYSQQFSIFADKW